MFHILLLTGYFGLKCLPDLFAYQVVEIYQMKLKTERNSIN